MNKVENHNEECINVFNSLLRGERSAVETYEKAIEKFADDRCASKLRDLSQSHAEAVGIIEENVRSMGGEPDQDSGAWGTFANAIQATANLFGEESAISSLQQGEEHGKRSYENALENDDVQPGCKDLIRSKLLPNVLSNINLLATLEEVV